MRPAPLIGNLRKSSPPNLRSNGIQEFCDKNCVQAAPPVIEVNIVQPAPRGERTLCDCPVYSRSSLPWSFGFLRDFFGVVLIP